MVKNFDDLIRYLLEAIAICGDQGAQLSDIIHHIEKFNSNLSDSDPNTDPAANNADCKSTPLIDHCFQEQVWKWLVAHPDCRVEIQGEKYNVTLTAAEAVNYFPPPANAQNSNLNFSNQEADHFDHQLIDVDSHSEGSNGIISNSEIRSSTLQKQDKTSVPKLVSRSVRDVRVYTTEDRRWHAVAGHGVDFSKIPQFDFICLSIIAAAGPKGILQPDLVRISKQDKRSVPRRTQKLCENGYIIKQPFLISGSRTSLCILKRFVKPSNNEKINHLSLQDNFARTGNDSESTFRQCFPDSKVDLCILLRAIFDILGDLKIIMYDDLKSSLGVIGRRWESRVVARTLRKLEALGCVKQVKAQDDTLGCDSKYFRCVKFIHEPGEKESQLIFGLSNVKMRKNNNIAEDLNSDEESIEGDHGEQATSFRPVNDRVQVQKLQQFKRLVPQWSGTGCINNNLYDLIHGSGTKGLSTMDIKNQMLGKYVLRPIEHQLSRIVDLWETSQPSHLRHLAIVRDIAMEKKSSYFLHFSFDNYKKLVDRGEASWEAVSTMSRSDKNRSEHVTPFHDELCMDEYGFPTLQSTLFQGQDNDATLDQCVRAFNLKPIPITKNDPVVCELENGSYVVQNFEGRSKTKSHNRKLKNSDKIPKISRAKGRPRKLQSAQSAIQLNTDENRNRDKSQMVEVQYQEEFLGQETTGRVCERGDLSDVMNGFPVKFADVGEKSDSMFGNVTNPYDIAVGNEGFEICPTSSSRKRKRSSKHFLEGEELNSGYLPSIVAHTQPTLQTSVSLLDNPDFNTIRRSIEELRTVEEETNTAPQSFELVQSQSSISTHTHPTPNKPGSGLRHSISQAKPTPGRPSKKIRSNKSSSKVFHIGKSHKYREMTYEEQSNLVERKGCGLFLGHNAMRARSKGHRGRTKNCRLAIFKSGRLSDFEWFTINGSPPPGELPLEIWDETRTFPSIENCIPPTTLEVESPQGPHIVGFQSLPGKLNTDMSGLDLNSNSLHSRTDASTLKTISDFPNGSGMEPPDDDLTPDQAVDVANTDDSRHPAIEVNEKVQNSQDEIINSYLTPPLNISSFTHVNQSAKSKLTPSERHSNVPQAEIDETGFSSSIGAPYSTTLDEVDHSIDDENLGLSKSTPVAQNEVASNDRDLAVDNVRTSSNTVAELSNKTSNSKSEDLSQISQQVTIPRGSVGVLRRKIIMDIIEICGGVFPGYKELTAPFVTAWMKLGKPGKPDGKTVHFAYRSLINCGKLRELKFSFQDSHGLMVTKSIITKIEINPADPRVQNIQEKVIASYPQHFIPEEIEVWEEVRNRAYFPSKWILHRYSTDLEVEDEMQVRLQHKPGYVLRKENQKAMMEKEKELNRGGETRTVRRKRCTEPGKDNPEKQLQQHLAEAPRATRRVERLASIKRSTKRDVLDLSMPGMDSLTNSHCHLLDQGNSLQMDLEFATPMDLSEVNNFDQTNSEKEEKDGNSASVIRKRRRRYSRTSELSQNAQISVPRQVKRRKLTDNHYNKFQWMSTIMAPKHLFHFPSGTFSVNFPGLMSPHEESTNMSSKKPNKETRRTPPHALLHRPKYLDPTHVFHPPSGTYSATFSGVGSAQRRPPNTLKRSVEKGYHTQSVMQQMPIVMNQKQIFHPSSGTFSLVFTGFGFQNNDPAYKSQKRSDEEFRTPLEIEIDDIMSWELMTESYLSSDYSNWPFVNYTMKDYRGVPGRCEYRLGRGIEVNIAHTTDTKSNDATGFLVFPRSSVFRMPTKKAETLAKKEQKETTFRKPEKALLKATSGAFRRKQAKLKLQFKTRPLTALVNTDALETLDEDELEEQRIDDSRPNKRRRRCGLNKQTPMRPEEEERLLAAVIAIRTLVGGIDRIVDWVLVARLFQPAYSQMYIQKRWTRVLHRFRLQMDQIQVNFQSRFARAYEDGSIPTLDFDDIEGYDWAWLVDWTMENIDTSTDSLKGLPVRRCELDDIFNLQSNPDNEMPEHYELDTAATTQRRENILNKRSYVYPSESTFQTSSPVDLDKVAIAKTWIRANVITPELLYDPKLARAKLSLIGESDIDIALQELLEARFLMQQNKGRLIPGRNYDISDFSLNRIRKKLNASQFRRAVAFKQKLDTDLLVKGSIDFAYTAENGDSLAVLNMLAHERVSVRPKNPPMEKFGVMGGGYMSRRMDKSRLNFDVEIRMGRSYIMGNPLSPFPPPPSQHLKDPMAKIPIWYDVHDNFVPIMWEMALTVTMLILALRPGVTGLEIEQSVKPTMGAWELDMILEWMVQAKAGKKTGTGYMVDEWWWMCLRDVQMSSTAGTNAEARHESQ